MVSHLLCFIYYLSLAVKKLNINIYESISESISELIIIMDLILIKYLKLSGLYPRGEMNLARIKKIAIKTY